MTTTRPGTDEVRYGGASEPQSAGLLGLGSLGFGLLAGSALLSLVIMIFFGWKPAVPLFLLIGGAFGVLRHRNRYRQTLLDTTGTALGYARDRRRGRNRYRSGPLSAHPWGTAALPGVLAQTRLLEVPGAYGLPFAVLHYPAQGHYVLVLTSAPTGIDLKDDREVDLQVGYWAANLTALGDVPGLVGAQVCVETAPDTGARLQRMLADRADPRAGEVALKTMQLIADTYPQATPSVQTWITLTFSAALMTDSPRRAERDVLHDLATRVPQMVADLSASGAGAVRPAGPAELCEEIRAAYDPAVAALLERIPAEGEAPPLSWTDVGPTATENEPTCYEHDGSVSQSWWLTDPTHGEVYASVLRDLLAPTAGITRKRFTLLLRPINRVRAAAIVEQDKRTADWLVKVRGERAPERAKNVQALAVQRAREVTKGSGLEDFTAIITATVAPDDPVLRVSPDEEWRTPGEVQARRVALAASAISSLSAGAQLLLRPAYKQQAWAFAVGLPTGIAVEAHLGSSGAARRHLQGDGS